MVPNSKLQLLLLISLVMAADMFPFWAYPDGTEEQSSIVEDDNLETKDSVRQIPLEIAEATEIGYPRRSLSGRYRKSADSLLDEIIIIKLRPLKLLNNYVTF